MPSLTAVDAASRTMKKGWVKKPLTSEQRQKMPRSDFALPGKGDGPKGAGAGSYPIEDASHARNALARVSQHGSSEEKSEVRAAVHRKFPGIYSNKKKKD
jgi:hypothetical protein